MACGITKGDRIGIWSINNFEWIVTQLATAKIGAILVNINPAYRVTELNNGALKSCSALIICEQFKTSNYEEMLREVLSRTESLRSRTIAFEANSAVANRNPIRAPTRCRNTFLELNHHTR